MLLFIAMTSLGEGPWQGDMSAVIAQCSEYTYLKSGKRIDGSMFSCTSMGIKLGGGIGIALSGWLLDISGYINMDNAVQPASCIKMMYFMYLWLPFIFDIRSKNPGGKTLPTGFSATQTPKCKGDGFIKLLLKTPLRITGLFQHRQRRIYTFRKVFARN